MEKCKMAQLVTTGAEHHREGWCEEFVEELNCAIPVAFI
jgi:hypothetical protein